MSEEHVENGAVAGTRGKVFMVIRLLNGRVGGAERLFIETANIFADAGYDTTCFYCDSRKGTPFYPVSPRVAMVNLYGRTARKAALYRGIDGLAKRFPRHRAFAPIDWLSKNLYFTHRLAAAIRGGKPDVVISFLPPANTPTLLAGALAGAKVIPTNHNVPEKDYLDPVRWDQNPVDKWLRFKLLDKAERVHVLFPTFAEWFPAEIQQKIEVVNNYVSPEFENVVFPKSRRKEIVGAGRLATVKNYDMVVEAWGKIAKDHPDWQVKIYGSGPEQSRLQARIDELGIRDSFHLMGHSSEMREAFLNAEILAHPAHHEGFGLSVAEALSCGLPVVAFKECEGVNEFVHDMYNGLMVSRAEGVDGYAVALQRLITDEELRLKLRREAPKSIEQFSIARFRDRWVEIIDAVKAEAHS